MPGFCLGTSEGPTYQWWGADFTVKVGELGRSSGLAVLRYTTEKGLEPPDHVHDTEDEIFLVMTGSVRFRCGDDEFDAEEGGLVFLPQGVQHGYSIQSDGPVELMVLTAPQRASGASDWSGFVGRVERDGQVSPSGAGA